MAYIFLDESGDLGFSRGSSRWFIFTAVLCDNPRVLEQLIKKARKSLSKKHKKVRELHAYEADIITRKRLLRQIAAIEDLKIFCVILDKEKVQVTLRNHKHRLYNDVASILLNRLYMMNIFSSYEPLYIFIDQKDTNKYLRNDFAQSILESLTRNHRYPIDIQIKGSHEENSLQVVDFISWALFRKHEQKDFLYYEMIQHLIREEYLVISP